jgi:hypothetical protein
LVSLDNHPHKLLIKLDSIEDGNENKWVRHQTL